MKLLAFLRSVLGSPSAYWRMWWRHGIGPYKHWKGMNRLLQETGEVHLATSTPWEAACGADDPDQWTSKCRDRVTCRCCLGDHKWVGHKNPDTHDGPGDWISYCDKCGMEEPGSWP